MYYYNKVCDGCSEIMLEGDDIVVCPECGTPQHRECYKKNNECVNVHLHAEGYDWRAAHAEQEAPKEAEPENEYDRFAIRALTQTGEHLGYIPRYYNKAILARIEKGTSYSCQVLEVTPAQSCSECVKVRLNMPSVV